MSAPGAPPETGGTSFAPESEDQNAPATLFDSNIPLPRPRPPEAPGPVTEARATPPSGPGSFPTSDERFMPGTAPNMAGQLTMPEPEPMPVPEQIPLPTPRPQPRQASVFSPTPMDVRQLVQPRRDQQIPRSMFSPAPIEGPLKGGKLNPQFDQRLNAMFAAMPEEIRGTTSVSSGYRSPERQAQLFAAAVRKYGSPEAARKWVAPPGGSKHQHGLAADLKFGSPAARQWIHQNAGRFGLGFRMAHEPWHIEPIDMPKGTKTERIATPLPQGGTNTFVKPSAGAGGPSYPAPVPPAAAPHPKQFADWTNKYGKVWPGYKPKYPLPQSSVPSEQIAELDSLSQTIIPPSEPEPFEALKTPFPMTAPIPSESFELPEEVAPVTKQRDPLEELNYLAVGKDKPNPLLDVTQLNTLPPPAEPPRVAAQGPLSVPDNIPEPGSYTPVAQIPNLNQPVQQEITPAEAGEEALLTDSEKALRFADTASRGVRQMGKGFLNLAQIPYVLGAGATGLISVPGKIAYPDAPPGIAEKTTNWLLERAADVGRTSEKWMGLEGTGTPRNPVEKLAEIGGSSIFPAGSQTVPLAGIVFSVQALLGHDSPLNVFDFMSAADAKPAKKTVSSNPEVAFEPAVDGHIKAGTVDIGKLNAEMTATHYINNEGQTVLIPNISVWGKNISISPEQAAEQYKKTGINFGVFDSPEAADKYLYLMNSRVVKPVNTLAGPGEMSLADVAKLSVPLIATVGVAFAPGLIGRFTQGRLWRPTIGRPVENAAPGTQAWSTQYEHARAYDDISAVPSLIARRQGLPQHEIAALEEIWSTQTRGGASNLAASAVENGIVHTPSLRFRVPTSYEKLNNAIDGPTTEYLYFRNALQDVQIREAAQARSLAARPNQPAPGPVEFQGMDRVTIQQNIARIEQANPEVRTNANVVRQNNRELNKFESEGEYGTMRPAERVRRDAEEPFRVNYGKNVQRETNPALANGNDMHKRIRFRVENEAKGITVDTMNQHRPGSFVFITEEQLRQNPAWRDNMITIRRRGVVERYTTDPVMAAAMRTNPYHAKDLASQIVSGTKTLFEAGTTGLAAPWFATTSMLRSHNIISATAPAMGWKAPHIGQTIAAIPRQLAPQFKMFLARSMDQHFGNWAGKNLGPYATPWLQGLGRRWEAQYKMSQDVLLQSAGARYGTILQHQEAANRFLDTQIMRATGPLRLFLKGWQKTFEAVHNAPGYATAIKNRNNYTREQLALGTRRLTGDPQAGGEYYPGGRSIQFQRYNQGGFHDAMDAFIHGGVKTYGVATEIGRRFVPWYNVSLQGAKRVVQAWRQDPVRFAAYMFMAQQLPAGAAFMWNRSLGKDPTGQSYSEYQMNMRSPYNTMLNFYIGIPGRPAAEGIELPGKYHEVVLWSRLMEIALDHMFKSNTHTFSQDFKDAAMNAMGVLASVPWHPLVVAAAGTQGIQMSQGPFEGQTYRRRQNTFDQNVGLPANVELVMRGFGGGISDILANGLNSMLMAEGWEKPGAFAQGMAEKAVQRTPILRNVAGITPKQAGNTRIVDEMFKRNGVFKMIDEYYRNYGVEGGGIKLTNKPASAEGGAIADRLLGRPPPAESPGLAQPVPKNPLYQEVMSRVHDMLSRDVPNTKGGRAPGMGYRSLWQRYSRATKVLSTLTPINPGNIKRWRERVEKEVPDAKAFLIQNNVDYKNPTAVINFYEGIRQNAAREILHTISKVEQQISERIGKPFKLEDLDPHKAPSKLPTWMPTTEVLEYMQGLNFAGSDVPEGGYNIVPKR